jgi:hypothetical protein
VLARLQTLWGAISSRDRNTCLIVRETIVLLQGFVPAMIEKQWLAAICRCLEAFVPLSPMGGAGDPTGCPKIASPASGSGLHQ